jgi:hypothetical protein
MRQARLTLPPSKLETSLVTWLEVRDREVNAPKS